VFDASLNDDDDDDDDNMGTTLLILATGFEPLVFQII
jgi:hypothetical protein